MNVRQRVLAALEHRQPDKVPYDVRFTKLASQKMAEYYGDADFCSKLGNCFTWFRPYPPGERYREVEPDVWQDEFGVEWDRRVDKDIGVPRDKLITPETLHDFAWPDPHDPRRYDFMAEAIQKDRVVVVSLGFTLFERAWSLVGMENLLVSMLSNKGFVNLLLDRILEYDLGIIDHACSLDIDVFRFGDDWGHQQGLLMGIDLWREFIKPRIKRMYQRVKSHGKYVMIHCCGKVQELLPELIECGVDIFNPLQPEVMDPFEMKQRHGDRLTFYGGIGTQRILPYGTVGQVRGEVRRLLDVVGENGGYIASPAHDLPPDAKPENVAAMLDVLQNQ